MAKDLYDVLGVKRTATDSEITKAYRKLARKYHPDRNPGDKQAEATFKEVQSAYDVLSDQGKRVQYDQFGQAGGPSPGGPGGFNFHAGGASDFNQADAERIFEQFFGGRTGQGFNPFSGRSAEGGRRRRAEPPPSQETEVVIPLPIAVVGGELDLNIAGQSVRVKIPSGIEDGKALRLAGQALGGGDLLLRIKLASHDYYSLENGELTISVPLSVAEAILGGAIDVPLPDGTQIAVKVPAGTSSGRKLRLRGKGVKGGDAYVRLQVMVPGEVNERAKELIQEFARIQPDNPRTGPFWAK